MRRREDGLELMSIGCEPSTYYNHVGSILVFYGKPDPKDENDDCGHRSTPSLLGGPGNRGCLAILRSFSATGGDMVIAARDDIFAACSGRVLADGVVPG